MIGIWMNYALSEWKWIMNVNEHEWKLFGLGMIYLMHDLSIWRNKLGCEWKMLHQYSKKDFKFEWMV